MAEAYRMKAVLDTTNTTSDETASYTAELESPEGFIPHLEYQDILRPCP